MRRLTKESPPVPIQPPLLKDQTPENVFWHQFTLLSPDTLPGLVTFREQFSALLEQMKEKQNIPLTERIFHLTYNEYTHLVSFGLTSRKHQVWPSSYIPTDSRLWEQIGWQHVGQEWREWWEVHEPNLVLAPPGYKVIIAETNLQLASNVVSDDWRSHSEFHLCVVTEEEDVALRKALRETASTR